MMKENRDWHLDPEVKAKWVEALRSGRYKQGTGRLCRNGKYCCLGVLCEVMGATKHEHSEADMVKGAVNNIAAFEYEGSSSYDVLPNTLAHKLGISVGGHLNTPIDLKDGHSPYEQLWALNDSALFTFDQIADVIEEQF